ncbi:MAG: nucleotidyl transferase AbiEii/AbiGii toxin family protein, partial [Candidatus Porifericomitaceae bacterium WSBS_2022_MAG_OTU9]
MEKDIWLCWTLRTIFSIPDRPQIAFKGGTSLSKVYNVISRFSEDLDITIDYRSFGEKIDPFAEGVSKSQIKKLSEALKAQVKKYANESMLPHIRGQLREFPQEKSFRSEISDNGEIIWLYYPSVVDGGDGGDAGYIENQILIELGGRNVTEPSEKHLVEADIAEIA